MKIVGERLRTLRHREGKTQKELSELLHTTQQIYSKYETAKSELPLRHLLVLARYYNVSADYLLGQIPYQKLPSGYSEPFVSNVTVGDFLCRVTAFSNQSKRRLVDYVNYLTYSENTARAKMKSRGEQAKRGNE